MACVASHCKTLLQRMPRVVTKSTHWHSALFRHRQYTTSSWQWFLHKEKRVLLQPKTLQDVPQCYYAKKSKRDHRDRKPSHHWGELTQDDLAQVINYEKFVHQMDHALEKLAQDYVEQLSLRTSAGAFDHLMIETDDGTFPLIQLAQVTNKNPQLIIINLASAPQYIPAVKQALEKSGMNISPQQDGSSLFVAIPKVTREHREKLAKSAKTLCDRTKEKLRDVQNKFVRDTKKGTENLSQDLVRAVQDHLHSLTHSYTERADKLRDSKQKELLGK